MEWRGAPSHSADSETGCPLSPYLFIMATDVLGHMLNDHHFGVKGMALPGGGKITY